MCIVKNVYYTYYDNTCLVWDLMMVENEGLEIILDLSV